MYVDEVGASKETVGLGALDVPDAQAQVVGLVDGLRMDSPDFAPWDLSVVRVETLGVLVAPVVFGLERVGPPVGLENHILVDILDVESGDCVEILGEFGRTAAFDWLFEDFLASVHPGVTASSIYVCDFHWVPDEFVSWVHHYL
jgi:hypothetical protein